MFLMRGLILTFIYITFIQAHPYDLCSIGDSTYDQIQMVVGYIKGKIQPTTTKIIVIMIALLQVLLHLLNGDKHILVTKQQGTLSNNDMTLEHMVSAFLMDLTQLNAAGIMLCGRVGSCIIRRYSM